MERVRSPHGRGDHPHRVSPRTGRGQRRARHAQRHRFAGRVRRRCPSLRGTGLLRFGLRIRRPRCATDGAPIRLDLTGAASLPGADSANVTVDGEQPVPYLLAPVLAPSEEAPPTVAIRDVAIAPVAFSLADQVTTGSLTITVENPAYRCTAWTVSVAVEAFTDEEIPDGAVLRVVGDPAGAPAGVVAVRLGDGGQPMTSPVAVSVVSAGTDPGSYTQTIGFNLTCPVRRTPALTRACARSGSAEPAISVSLLPSTGDEMKGGRLRERRRRSGVDRHDAVHWHADMHRRNAMNVKLKFFGLVATAIVLLGISSPALAQDGDDDEQDVDLTITSTDIFSIEVFHSTNFPDTQFTLDGLDSGNVGNASYDFEVTDLRGTGDGWNVNVASSEFANVDTLAVVPDAELHSTNNSDYASFFSSPLPPHSVDVEADQFGSTSGSVRTGVSANSVWDDIIGSGHVLLSSDDGVDGVFPNGTGYFQDEEALYLNFPGAVAAGTYEATVTLTLTSGNP